MELSQKLENLGLILMVRWPAIEGSKHDYFCSKDLWAKVEEKIFAKGSTFSPINSPRGGGFWLQKLRKNSQTLPIFFLKNPDFQVRARTKKKIENPRENSSRGGRFSQAATSQSWKKFGSHWRPRGRFWGERKKEEKSLWWLGFWS